MGELTIEQKAKLYDEAIKRAKAMIPIAANQEETYNSVITIFPELKGSTESEDERTRKGLIAIITDFESLSLQKNYSLSREDILAWLEKQGEQKPVDLVAILKDYFANTPKEQQDKDLEELKHLNNFGWKLIEQKPVEKIEPKFKQGEWIIFNGLILYVDEVVQGYYRTISIDGIPNSYDWDIDNAARLWTIQEAKAGDVLATKTGGVFIYKELLYDKPFAYCGVDKFGVFKDCNCGDGLDWTPYLSEVTPATKEQRDTLMKAMADKGYTFDFEKKELKKIEKNPVWSEEDDRMIEAALQFAHEYGRHGLWAWLKGLKDRIQPQTTWKPSDEQMDALEHFVRSIGESGYASPHDNNTKLVYSLLSDLKKLREE